MDVDYSLDMNNDFLTIHTSKKNKHMTINDTSIKTLFSLPMFIDHFYTAFHLKLDQPWWMLDKSLTSVNQNIKN